MNPLEGAIFSHRAEHGALRSAYFNLWNVLTRQTTISFPNKCYTSFRYRIQDIICLRIFNKTGLYFRRLIKAISPRQNDPAAYL